MPEDKIDRTVENSAIGGFLQGRHDRRDNRPPISIKTIKSWELSKMPQEALDDAAARWATRQARKAAREAASGGKRAFPTDPSPTKSRKTKLAVMGIPKEALEAGDPAYGRCIKLASAYRMSRARELALSHGYVSSGVSALLATAALALASSRFLFERAASEPRETVTKILKAATDLADSARQNELAAWELCARERVAKNKMAMNEAGVPWIVGKDEPEKALVALRADDSQKRGVKPKQDQALIQTSSELILPPVGTPLEGWVQSAKIPEGIIEGG